MNKQHYILWLPSWYPNRQQPYNGDFIQRHAQAASFENPIVVIFFTQYGERSKTQKDVSKHVAGNLHEIIVYIPFKPLKIRLIDRIYYNIIFYRFSKKFLKSFFRANGLPSLVHVHVPMKSGNLALWIKRRFSIPYIVSEHASTYLKQAPDNFFERHWLYKFQVKRIFSEAVAVTNVSLAIGQILMKLFPINKFYVIHNVVNTEAFKPAFSSKDVFTYVHVSSLDSQKNISGILRVFKNLAKIRNDWKLILVGPYSDEIKKYIESEGLDHLVSLIGLVPYLQVADYINQAHVMVLFSRHENFPCVVIEALCCGLPVIASDVAGISEAVDASNGILVESENESALLVALEKIRENYSDYDLSAIAENARKKFSYSIIAKQFSDLYQKVGI